MNRKQLWLLAGGNGAGKSTFYHNFLAPLGMPFVNADIIAKDFFPDDPEQNSYRASQLAEQMREKLILKGKTFCFETVFSHVSKIDFIGKAKALGYEVILVFIHVESSGLNKARVSQRVAEGGHNVPNDKIESRIPRVLENVKTAIPLCDQVRVLDNSSCNDPFQTLAIVNGNQIESIISDAPNWLSTLLSDQY